MFEWNMCLLEVLGVLWIFHVVLCICMYVDFVLIWVQFAGKLRNICGLVWWLAFLQTVLNWKNFLVNVNIFSKCQH